MITQRASAGECTPLPWRPDMDLELTDEQRLIRETARDFTGNESPVERGATPVASDLDLIRALAGVDALVPR